LASTTSIPELDGALTLLFRVGATTYGCGLAEAREIVALRPMTRLPGSPAYVRGLINMRGTIVTVLDLGVRLDSQRRSSEEGSILLVRHRDRVVGVIVDEVVDVRAVDVDRDGSSESGGIIHGVATLDDGAVVILDLDVLITQVLLS
jgi:purine-binding chemotaxis protein CheW